MKLRPFALLSTSILNRTNRLLAEALEEWRTAWGLDMLDIRIECVRAWDAEPAQPALPWQRCYAQGQKSVWIAWQPEFFRYVQRHLFPPDQRHVLRPGGEISLASEGAEKATLAFSERVAGAAGLAVTDAHGTHIPPSAVFDRGSGAVFARIRVGEQSAACVFNYDCIRAMNDTPASQAAAALPVADIRTALRNIPLALPIEIGQAEVEVGALMTLAVGDVIRLQASVDKPLTVYGPERNALFDGYLGTVERNVALEVVRRDK